MTKRWHKSTKRKPKAYEDIIIIWKSGDVSVDEMMIDEYGESYLFCADDSYTWEVVAPDIKQWAYVKKYFSKELEQ